MFKLRYAYIDICKSLRGTLRFLELGGATGQQSAFTHTCEYFSDNVGVEVWSGSHSDACSPKYEIAHATPGTAQAGRGKDISSLVPRGADGPEQRDDLHDTAVLHVRHLGRWEARVDLCSGPMLIPVFLQTVSGSRRIYSRPSWSSSRVLRKPSPRAAGKNVSVRIYASCAVPMTDR